MDYTFPTKKAQEEKPIPGLAAHHRETQNRCWIIKSERVLRYISDRCQGGHTRRWHSKLLVLRASYCSFSQGEGLIVLGAYLRFRHRGRSRSWFIQRDVAGSSVQPWGVLHTCAAACAAAPLESRERISERGCLRLQPRHYTSSYSSTRRRRLIQLITFGRK